jgi:hypothetical protein
VAFNTKKETVKKKSAAPPESTSAILGRSAESDDSN